MNSMNLWSSFDINFKAQVINNLLKLGNSITINKLLKMHLSRSNRFDNVVTMSSLQDSLLVQVYSKEENNEFEKLASFTTIDLIAKLMTNLQLLRK
jgi:hypothetical protein